MSLILPLKSTSLHTSISISFLLYLSPPLSCPPVGSPVSCVCFCACRARSAMTWLSVAALGAVMCHGAHSDIAETCCRDFHSEPNCFCKPHPHIHMIILSLFLLPFHHLFTFIPLYVCLSVTVFFFNASVLYSDPLGNKSMHWQLFCPPFTSNHALHSCVNNT